MTSSPFDAWDVVVVPFPYSDKLAEKRRPALVVSNTKLGSAGLLWIAMITSAGKPPQPGDVTVGDLAMAGLAGPSIVRAAKIACIEPSRVRRRVGTLVRGERRQVAKEIASMLAKA